MPDLKGQFYEEFIGWLKDTERPGDLTDADNDELNDIWEMWKKANELSHLAHDLHRDYLGFPSVEHDIERIMDEIEDRAFDYFSDSGELQKLINAKYGEDE